MRLSIAEIMNPIDIINCLFVDTFIFAIYNKIYAYERVNRNNKKGSLKSKCYLVLISLYHVNSLDEEAVAFARSYEQLIYFGHALEVLLHQVLEDEAELSVGTGHGKVYNDLCYA